MGEPAVDLATSEVLEENRQPQNMGAIIQRMGAIRDERRTLSKRDSELVAEWESLDTALIGLLEGQGMKRASIDGLTASISIVVVPNVEDWDEFYEYMKEEDALYLLQRRPATKAFRELHDAGITVPGVRAVERKSISLRKS